MNKENNIETQNLCPHCNKPLQKSRNKEYAFECLDCDEDFYSIEIKTAKNSMVKDQVKIV
ncbi:MAG: hypothetical protein LBR45_00145 [Bacteroidales bacterium]|jgi:ribosomal protein L37AE/L43A|nr:hypothetical protein [Bacteroidales bacterium]